MSDAVFTYNIAAWIDLLGQTEALERIPDFPKTSEERERFLATLKPTFGRIKRVRELIAELHQQMTQPLKLPEGQYTEEHRATFERHTTANISYSFIADSALLNICLQDDGRGIPPVYSIYTLFEQLSLLTLSSLAASAPIRGAIEIGICSELENGEMYGQAISRAHYIENKRAHYPRIVIGPNFANFLKYIDALCRNSSLPPPQKNLLIHWSSLINDVCEHDTYDGQLILSYLRQCKTGSGQDPDSYNSLLKEASSFIGHSISKYSSDGNIKLIKRYNALKSYFVRHDCLVPNDDEISGGKKT